MQTTENEEYRRRWFRFGRKQRDLMIMTAPRLMELGDILEELDEVMRETECPAWEGYPWDKEKGGIRGQLERVLGMVPGALDTSRKAARDWRLEEPDRNE